MPFVQYTPFIQILQTFILIVALLASFSSSSSSSISSSISNIAGNVQLYPVEEYNFEGNVDLESLLRRGWSVFDSLEHKRVGSSSNWAITSDRMVQSSVMDGSVSSYYDGTILRRSLATGWSDLEVETNMKFSRGAEPGLSIAKEGTIGIIFRVTNDGNYYRAYISTWSNSLILDQVIDYQHRTLSTINMTVINNNQNIKLVVRAISARITVFIDDENVIDVIDPLHEKATGTVGLYVSGTLLSSSFDYLRVSPPPSLLEFTKVDGSTSNDLNYGVPYYGYERGNDIMYRVTLSYCGQAFSSSGDNGLWIRVILNDPRVASLVRSPLLYVGCGPAATNVHNLVVVHPNTQGKIVLNHVTKDNGDEINKATRGSHIISVDKTATPILIETYSTHYLQPGDIIQLVGIDDMPLLNGRSFHVGRVFSEVNKFELKGIGPSSIVDASGILSLGVYAQKNGRWTGKVISNMGSVHLHVQPTQPGPPSPKSVDGVFPSGHITISWDPPTNGYDGSPLPCAESIIDGYIIVRDDGLKKGGRGYRSTEFVDYQVEPGNTYKYVIHAVCANGIVGVGSAPIVTNTGNIFIVIVIIDTNFYLTLLMKNDHTNIIIQRFHLYFHFSFFMYF
jgi:hypothetical protein